MLHKALCQVPERLAKHFKLIPLRALQLIQYRYSLRRAAMQNHILVSTIPATAEMAVLGSGSPWRRARSPAKRPRNGHDMTMTTFLLSMVLTNWSVRCMIKKVTAIGHLYRRVK